MQVGRRLKAHKHALHVVHAVGLFVVPWFRAKLCRLSPASQGVSEGNRA
jgi:hypothetical protein